MSVLYLLWSVINLAALAWFLYIGFSVLKWIKEHLGMGALVIFILGSFSFIKGMVMNDKPETTYNEPMTMGIYDLNKELLYSTTLFYAYPKDATKGDVKADIVQSGLVIGHGWKTHSTAFDRKDDQLHYAIVGTHEWRFFGLNLYPETKRFTGVVK